MKRFYKIIKAATSILIVCTMVVGVLCVMNDNAYAASPKNRLKKKTVTLIAGKTYQQKLLNNRGKTISATKVKWKSSKPSVATVTKKGKVKGRYAGTAKITAKYKGKTYKFTVRVKKPKLKAPKNVSLRKENVYNGGVLDGDLMLVFWDPVRNASDYQLYYSKNGSPYKYYMNSGIDFCELGYVDGKFLNGDYSFKVRAVAGRYKGPFSKIKTIKVKRDNIKYSAADINKLSTYVWNAAESTEYVADYVNYWSYDDYSSSSDYASYIKKSAKDAASWLNKAKAITSSRKNRNCTSKKAINEGFSTWDNMIGNLLNRCNKIKNSDIKKMSEYERMMMAEEMLKIQIGINTAYLEIEQY